MSDKLPRMDYRQHRRARRLVHECCNYDEGNCLLLFLTQTVYPNAIRLLQTVPIREPSIM